MLTKMIEQLRRASDKRDAKIRSFNWFFFGWIMARIMEGDYKTASVDVFAWGVLYTFYKIFPGLAP